MKVGKKVFRHGAEKPPVKDEEALKNIKSEQELKVKSHNDELRKVIEERKRKTLEELAAKKKNFIMKWPGSSLLNKKKLRLRRKKLTKES